MSRSERVGDVEKGGGGGMMCVCVRERELLCGGGDSGGRIGKRMRECFVVVHLRGLKSVFVF